MAFPTGPGVSSPAGQERPRRSTGFAAAWAYVGAAMVLTASLQWMLPVLRERAHPGSYAYVPIREAWHGGGNDKYFYYAHIREIIDGNFPSHDPVCFEHKDRHTPHITYSFSLLMCALGGMITGRTEHAYYFNLLVYPLASLVLAYLVLHRLTGRRELSLLLAFCALVYQEPHRLLLDPLFQLGKLGLYGLGALPPPAPGVFPYPDRSGANLLRTPNVLFVNVVVLATFLQAHRVLAAGRRSWPNILALIGLLLASTFTSAPAFVVCVGTVAAMSAAVLGESGRRQARVLLASALAIGAAGAWVVGRLGAISVESAKMADISYPLLWQIDAAVLWRDLAVLLPGTLLVWLSRHRARRTLLASAAAFCALYVAMTLLKGSWAASHEVYRRGFQPLFTLLVCAALVQMLERGAGLARGPGGGRGAAGARLARGLRVVRPLLPLCLVVLPALEVWMQYRHTELKLSWWSDRDFKEFADWSRTHLAGDEVALTLDADVLVNLPVYSPVNVYLPPALLSAADRSERLQRLAETAWYYGMDRARFTALLRDLVPAYDVLVGRYRDPERDFVPIRLGLLDLALFYNQHHPGTLYPFTEAEREEIVAGLDRVAAAGRLQYRHDFLIVTPFDRLFIQPGSPAARAMESGPPLYAGPRYAVYRIGGRGAPGGVL